MTIELQTPTCWKELTTEQLRYVVEMGLKELSREKYLLVLLCKFSGIKMLAGTSEEDGKRVVHTRFKDAEGNVFDLEDWQLSDFCGRLAFVLDEQMPMDVAWPWKWNRYLYATAFGDWFHADAMMLRFSMTEDMECLKKAAGDLMPKSDNGGKRDDDVELTEADAVLLLRWYECFKDWLQERYPLVFQKTDSPSTGSETYSPVEARQNIMLMLNDNRPQDNELIEKSNVHDVLAALQHKIEYAKQIEEQTSNIKH